MAFDSDTRKKLAGMVADARALLRNEFTSQLQEIYGIQPDGEITPLEKLAHLDDEQREAARFLRERVSHLASGMGKEKNPVKSAVDRMTREQAFTVLNRFAALRMCEDRGLLQQCVGNGLDSEGFAVYLQVAGTGLGSRYERYCSFIFCVFDEIAVDLGILFDRFSPFGLLFPRETALNGLVEIITRDNLQHIWSEDEAIGWIYQYFNTAEERKAMRKASQAPRNSRELAVRNQFFTPRYVVEFLTDNTLGRIWYEMCEGDTGLKEACRYLVKRPNEVFLASGEKAPDEPENKADLSQEDLLNQTVYIEHRPKKDPRDLRVLDPACGSGHFLLYAFDLLEHVYEEAWGDIENPKYESTGHRLREEFASLDDLHRAVPKMIIEHNLHGIDIDPRAVQIAALALWMRAQKSWKSLGIKVGNRPQIKKSNIITAEPMPGNDDMRQEFISGIKPRVLGQIVDVIFDKMKLAGEAGSLLKIEEEIKDVIAEAKRQWLIVPKPEQQDLFQDMKDRRPKQQELRFDLEGVTDERFWGNAENRILDELKTYSERKANGYTIRRRLFADDTARGFAFIDVCRKRYDVVLMNPPFGEAAIRSVGVLRRYSIKNLYSCFIERASEVANDSGFFAAITDSTYLKLPSYFRLRNQMLLGDKKISNIVDLGWNVLDANVRTALLICKASCPSFFNSLDISDKEDREVLLLEASKNCTFKIRHHVDVTNLPKSVLALNMPLSANDHLTKLPQIKSIAELPWGCGANDSTRLFRLRWEVEPALVGKDWAFLTNGGEYSPLYRENYFLCRIRVENGDSAFTTRFKGDSDTLYDASAQHLYFKPGLTYPKRSRFLHLSALPEGHIFTPEGKGFFIGDFDDRYFYLAILNSVVVTQMSEYLCGPHKQRGDVELVGVPKCSSEHKIVLSLAAEDATLQIQALATSNEDSALFISPQLWESQPIKNLSLIEIINIHKNKVRQTAQSVQSAYDLFDKYARGICPWLPIDGACQRELGALREKQWKAYDLRVDDFLSYFIGLAFGHWDIQLVMGEKQVQQIPDPFEPLPVCPFGRLQNVNGLPLTRGEVEGLTEESQWNYPIKIPWNGILVDDTGYDEAHPHRDDIICRVREVLDLLWKENAHNIEQEACDILGAKSLRDYFRKPTGFFQDHLKRYSKSRRKAPIYWPLSTESGSYTIWIYYHRLTDQTLFVCVEDYLKPKIDEVTRDINRLQKNLADVGTAKMRSDLDQLQDFRQELIDMQDELLRVAKLPYKPNLNDGVIITASPMWKLFRLKKWQNDLKKCWGKLETGDYDWAHLAYSIWPERVREKCKSDRSLAIAHDLEDICEVEIKKPKKRKPRKKAEHDLTLKL